MATQFQRNAAPTKNAGAKRSMKYGGVPSAGNRSNYPHEGNFRVKLLSARGGNNGDYDFIAPEFEVISYEPAPTAQRTPNGDPMHAPGSTIGTSQFYSGNCEKTGVPRLILMTRALAGFDNDKDFIAFLEEHAREFVDENSGVNWSLVLEMIGEFRELTEKGITVIGRTVDLTVTRGKEFTKDDGTVDWYRNYAWRPVPDDEQA
jgi:hypothetical protein